MNRLFVVTQGDDLPAELALFLGQAGLAVAVKGVIVLLFPGDTGRVRQFLRQLTHFLTGHLAKQTVMLQTVQRV